MYLEFDRFEWEQLGGVLTWVGALGIIAIFVWAIVTGSYTSLESMRARRGNFWFWTRRAMPVVLVLGIGLTVLGHVQSNNLSGMVLQRAAGQTYNINFGDNGANALSGELNPSTNLQLKRERAFNGEMFGYENKVYGTLKVDFPAEESWMDDVEKSITLIHREGEWLLAYTPDTDDVEILNDVNSYVEVERFMA